VGLHSPREVGGQAQVEPWPVLDGESARQPHQVVWALGLRGSRCGTLQQPFSWIAARTC
jgi:hypothetical protein